jgi:flagellar biosynthesis component FlhA
MTVYSHYVQGSILVGAQIFLIIVIFGLVLGCMQPPVQWAKGALYLRIEQQSLKLARIH